MMQPLYGWASGGRDGARPWPRCTRRYRAGQVWSRQCKGAGRRTQPEGHLERFALVYCQNSSLSSIRRWRGQDRKEHARGEAREAVEVMCVPVRVVLHTAALVVGMTVYSVLVCGETRECLVSSVDDGGHGGGADPSEACPCATPPCPLYRAYACRVHGVWVCALNHPARRCARVRSDQMRAVRE